MSRGGISPSRRSHDRPVSPAPGRSSLDVPFSSSGTLLADASPDQTAQPKSRLAFLSSSSKPSPVPNSLLPPRSHSRADSRGEGPAMAATPPTKPVVSPGKGASARGNYDSKLVQREMHRLGGLSSLPAALAPALATAASASAISLPSSAKGGLMGPNMTLSAGPSADNPWSQLHVFFLPLFNGEPLRFPIEDLNTLVKRHIQAVVSHAPARAIASLENDTNELIASGMVTMNAKLAGVDDEKLLPRVIELWGFFWDQVLPYIEGVLLPLQTDPVLLSLYRTPKSHNPSSNSISGLGLLSAPHLDVRSLALLSFRDRIVQPIHSRLQSRLVLARQREEHDPLFPDAIPQQQPRLQQMLLVLLSQGRSRPSSLSLTAPLPQPTAGEAAIASLLKASRPPTSNAPLSPSKRASRAPTFLSRGTPRDRRGRIAGRRKGSAGLEDGEETPRQFRAEREFLEALRSPTAPERDAGAQQQQMQAMHGMAQAMEMGGWGLGGAEEVAKATREEDEDDVEDWEYTQLAVEKLVGMNFTFAP